MQTFRVWAPLPKKVELQLNGKTFPDDRDDGRLVDGGSFIGQSGR